MLRSIGFALVACCSVIACAAEDTAENDSTEALDVARHRDAGAFDSGIVDAGPVTSNDGGSDDGTPVRNPCTSSFGSGLAGLTHGRLDGTLVSIVAPGATSACNDDAHHVHLQIEMNGGVYDIAVNVSGVLTAERDATLADGAWSEGWHAGDSLDFPSTLGLHSTDFTAVNETAIAQHVEQILANVNHISVFATKYSNGGAHLVHRNGNGNDGALVLYPLSGQPHFVMFSFPNQSF